MLNCESSEAKRKFSIVEKIISKWSEHVYIEEFKYLSKVNTFVSSKIYFEAKWTRLYRIVSEESKLKNSPSQVSFDLPVHGAR